MGIMASTFGAAGSETSTTARELASLTLGSPNPGTCTVPKAVCRSTPEAASALGNPKAGNGRPVAARARGIGAGNRPVLEHPEVCYIELAAIRRERQGEWQRPTRTEAVTWRERASITAIRKLA